MGEGGLMIVNAQEIESRWAALIIVVGSGTWQEEDFKDRRFFKPGRCVFHAPRLFLDFFWYSLASKPR
jgi:hypothetical protein